MGGALSLSMRGGHGLDDPMESASAPTFLWVNSGHQACRATRLPTVPSAVFLKQRPYRTWSLFIRLHGLCGRRPGPSFLCPLPQGWGAGRVSLCSWAVHLHAEDLKLQRQALPVDLSPCPPPTFFFLEIRSGLVAQASLTCPLSCPNAHHALSLVFNLHLFAYLFGSYLCGGGGRGML